MTKFAFWILLFSVFSCSSSTQKLAKQDVIKNKETELNELKARVDDLNNRVYVLTEQVDSLRAGLSFQPTKAKPQTTTVSKVINNIEADYKTAYDFFKNGNYTRALLAFTSFIEKYPNSAITDNATYWMGESYYMQKEYPLAIEEYSKVLKNFPNGSKAPHAMYKIALSYKKLGENKDAQTYYSELVSRFPNSEITKQAKKDPEFKK